MQAAWDASVGLSSRLSRYLDTQGIRLWHPGEEGAADIRVGVVRVIRVGGEMVALKYWLPGLKRIILPPTLHRQVWPWDRRGHSEQRFEEPLDGSSVTQPLRGEQHSPRGAAMCSWALNEEDAWSRVTACSQPTGMPDRKLTFVL